MCYPSQPTGRPISQRNEWSFLCLPLRDFSSERNFRSSAATGLNSRRFESPQHDIFWWCHINKCRPKRGNRIELAPVQKSPRYHMNTPSSNYFDVVFFPQVRNVSDSSSNNLKIPLDSQNEEVVSNVSSLPLFFFFP